MFTRLTRWFMRRHADPKAGVDNACPACTGELLECSKCRGKWQDHSCADCRLGRICTCCHLSWAYYVQGERTT